MNDSLSQLQQLLAEQDYDFDAYEVEALLVGLIAGGITLDGKAWKQPLTSLLLGDMALTVKLEKAIAAVYADVLAALSAPELDYQLSLVERLADKELSQRLLQLCDWVQSYLVGFAISQPSLEQLDDDVREMILDLNDISRVELAADELDEEAEAAYEELLEYVRVVVLNCFFAFSPKPKSAEQQGTLQ